MKQCAVAIDSDIPFVPRKRGQRAEVYPFSKLEVGQSFVVPVSREKPRPEDVVMRFASTVAVARKRLMRKFQIQPVTKGTKYPNGQEEYQSGARIFRMA